MKRTSCGLLEHPDTSSHLLITLSGLRSGYNYPARITIVNANRLQLRFIDDELNEGEYFLNRTPEIYDDSLPSNGQVIVKDDGSSLTDDEELLFEYLKNDLTSFKNPASVRIVEVYAYNEDKDVFYVDISAENSLGGNVLKLYEVGKTKTYESMSSRDIFEHITISPGEPCSCDVSTINNLLKEYYSEMGWD